ncbi:MAG: SDR family NAD(P)-dependent oxidoreductase [Myxococcota bacterium]|nr:SDR family NAD(P)-dependent oxidoreductase [Myxococcota bacterium]
MSTHGRFRNPVEATLTGIKDLFGHQALAGELTDALRADGRTCLVTGASTGLGFAIATQLATRGARVLTVSRSGVPEKGEEIRRLSGSGQVEMFRTDLSDLEQVHALADELRARGERIDVLVDNAGVATAHSRKTAQGLDAMFVTNFLSKVVLSLRLLGDGTIRNHTFADAPREEAPVPRVVFVSSDSHRGASAIDWEDFGRYVDYGVNRAINNYSYFKLVLNTYCAELGRRLAPGGEIDVPVHAMCPGPVNSDIVRDAGPALRAFLKAIFSVVFRSPEVAARPAVYACLSPDFESETGRYLHMFNPKRMDEKCYDEAEGARLWEESLALLRSVGAARGLPA